MIHHIYRFPKGKKPAVFAFLFALCFILATITGAASNGAGGGETAVNSGLIYRGYSVYAQDTSRVLTEIFGGDNITVVARFRIPDSITLHGVVKAQFMGGGFNGGVDNVAITEQELSVTLDLQYTGSKSTQVMFNLSGSRSLGEGEVLEFNDPRNVNIGECVPDDTGAESITPSGPSEPPKFAVDLSAKFPVANAGQKYVFEIPVKNTGKQAAKDITVTIDPGSADTFPFEYDRYAFTARMAELSINAVRDARFEVRVLPTAKDGPHTIKINFSGRTVLGVGSLSESSETIVINVKNTNTPPKLTLERISLSADAAPASVQNNVNEGSASVQNEVIGSAAGARRTIDSITPGENFYLSVYIKNSGSLPAKNIALTIKGLKADGISTNNSPAVLYIKQLNGSADSAQTFELTCAKGMAGDRTEMSLGITFNDETGKEYSGDSQIFIPLEQSLNKSAYSGFELVNISSPSGSLTEDANFRISFSILNTGDVPMEDVKLTCAAGSEFIGKSLNTRMLKPIPAGESVPVFFDFGVSKNYSSGNFPISFTVEYTPGDPDGKNAGTTGGSTVARHSATQYVGIQLYKPEVTTTTTTTESTTTTGKDPVPKIIISNYEYMPAEAKAGQTVDITLTFFNTSMTQTVQNIKIQLDSDTENASGYSSASSGVFTPVEGSNSFYIEEIFARQEVSKSIKLMIKGDAEAKSYQLYSIIEYEDSKANAITTKESISIPVTQVTKVTIGDIMLSSPSVFMYQPFSASYTFINMGKSTLYNVMASIEGPFTSQAQGYYAGNMQPGAQDYYDASLIPESGGEQIGFAVIKYEDAQGSVHEERMEFPFSAMEMPDYGDAGMDGGGMVGYPGGFEEMPTVNPEGGGEGFSGLVSNLWQNVQNLAIQGIDIVRRFVAEDPWLAAALAAGILILIIIIVSLVRRAKHKRLERELNKMAEYELDAGDPSGNGRKGNPPKKGGKNDPPNNGGSGKGGGKGDPPGDGDSGKGGDSNGGGGKGDPPGDGDSGKGGGNNGGKGDPPNDGGSGNGGGNGAENDLPVTGSDDIGNGDDILDYNYSYKILGDTDGGGNSGGGDEGANDGDQQSESIARLLAAFEDRDTDEV